MLSLRRNKACQKDATEFLHDFISIQLWGGGLTRNELPEALVMIGV